MAKIGSKEIPRREPDPTPLLSVEVLAQKHKKHLQILNPKGLQM